VGHMLANGVDEKKAARVIYVSATSAMQRLVISVNDGAKFASQLTTTNT
jgi:hypothetical protein